jgi:hypothetical protein
MRPRMIGKSEERTAGSLRRWREARHISQTKKGLGDPKTAQAVVL